MFLEAGKFFGLEVFKFFKTKYISLISDNYFNKRLTFGIGCFNILVAFCDFYISLFEFLLIKKNSNSVSKNNLN